MKCFEIRLFLLIILFIPKLITALESGISIITQQSPHQNILHVHIDLVNIEGETFNNATAVIDLSEEELFFLRISAGSDGSVAVSPDNKIITWTTNTDSSSKGLHLYIFVHKTGEFTLTTNVIDDQGVSHTYTSNTYSTHFPLMRDTMFIIEQNETLVATLTDLIVSTELPAEPVVKMQIRPNGAFGTATPIMLEESPFLMTYIPALNFKGYDSFEIIGFDANDDTDSSSIFIAVGVEGDPTTDYVTFLRQLYNPAPINKRPSTRDINITVDHAETRLIFLKDYSVNYFNTEAPLTYAINTENINFANVTLVDGDTVEYASTTSEGSEETFVDTMTYSVTDPNGNSVQATITITTQEPEIG